MICSQDVLIRFKYIYLISLKSRIKAGICFKQDLLNSRGVLKKNISTYTPKMRKYVWLKGLWLIYVCSDVMENFTNYYLSQIFQINHP